jgi:hypothetical protein
MIKSTFVAGHYQQYYKIQGSGRPDQSSHSSHFVIGPNRIIHIDHLIHIGRIIRIDRVIRQKGCVVL